VAEAVVEDVLREMRAGFSSNDLLEKVAHKAIVNCAKKNPIVINGAHVLVVHDSDWPKAP